MSLSLSFRGAERKARITCGFLVAPISFSYTKSEETVPIIGFMSPPPFTPEKECYSVLFLHFFEEPDINEP